MKTIVITHPEVIKDEQHFLIEMFESGLKTLHVRKPKYSKDELINFIESIPKKYHKRLVLHSHHKLVIDYHLKGIHLKEKDRKSPFKFMVCYLLFGKIFKRYTMSTSVHSPVAIKSMQKYSFNYIFMSPVFKSLFKDDYKPKYSLSKVKDAIDETRIKVYALGGIEDYNVNICKEAGFYGVALLGYVWNTPHHLERYKKIKEICKNKNLEY